MRTKPVKVGKSYQLIVENVTHFYETADDLPQEEKDQKALDDLRKDSEEEPAKKSKYLKAPEPTDTPRQSRVGDEYQITREPRFMLHADRPWDWSF